MSRRLGGGALGSSTLLRLGWELEVSLLLVRRYHLLMLYGVEGRGEIGLPLWKEPHVGILLMCTQHLLLLCLKHLDLLLKSQLLHCIA